MGKKTSTSQQRKPISVVAGRRAVNAVDSRVGSRLPPTVAWKNGGSGLMFCDRATP